MKQGQDISTEFPGLLLIHQKIPGRTVDSHAHEEHELFVPLQGEIAISLADGRKLAAGPGRMIYLPPGMPHSFLAAGSGQGERLIAIVDPRQWKVLGGGRHEASVLPSSQLVRELLFHLLLNPRTRGAKALIEVWFTVLDEMLEARAGFTLEALHLSGKARDPRLLRALQALETGFAERLSMTKLARSASLSVRSLNRLFTSELGLTPKQFTTALRIERAKELLKVRGATVTDVALEVGYQSVSHFITTFRQLTGKLPSEW